MITSVNIGTRRVREAHIIRVQEPSDVQTMVFEEFERNAMFETPQHDTSAQTEQAQQEQSIAEYTHEQMELEVQEAYDRGFNDGKQVTAALLDTEMTKLREWVKNLDTTIIEVTEQFTNQRTKLEQVSIDVALSIAEHILATTVHAHASAVAVEQARKALQQIHGASTITLRVSSESYDALKEAEYSMRTSLGAGKTLHIECDDSVEKGGCIVQTESGIIDAQLQTQLKTIREELRKNAEVKELPEEF